MTTTPAKPDSARQLKLGLLFGIVFGFLLQKGGMVKYEVLMGQFFLTDFTVIKVMLTAIIVGMIGIFSLRAGPGQLRRDRGNHRPARRKLLRRRNIELCGLDNPDNR
jgi:hypothetical protein